MGGALPGSGRGGLMGGVMEGVDMEVWVFCSRFVTLVVEGRDGESPDFTVRVCECKCECECECVCEGVRVCVCEVVCEG